MNGITSSEHEGVLTLRLDRPEKRNALNREMIVGLTEAVRTAAAGRTIRAIVIAGGPVAFCAGADIAAYSGASAESLAEFTATANTMCNTLAGSPLPIVAAISGLAIGGGFELALSCDLIVAADTATFALPELSLGLIPGWGGSQRLKALIGINRTKEFVWFGTGMTATEAHALGIVSRVVAADRLGAEAADTAARLAKLPARAVESTKRAVAADGAEGFAVERHELLDLFASPDGIEGVDAFVQKRTAMFAAGR